VMWQLPIGVKVIVRGLATSEWGGRTDNSYGTRLFWERLDGDDGRSDSRR
jgi:hypothetical protein